VVRLEPDQEGFGLCSRPGFHSPDSTPKPKKSEANI
jgi:hypothetical protein